MNLPFDIGTTDPDIIAQVNETMDIQALLKRYVRPQYL